RGDCRQPAARRERSAPDRSARTGEPAQRPPFLHRHCRSRKQGGTGTVAARPPPLALLPAGRLSCPVAGTVRRGIRRSNGKRRIRRSLIRLPVLTVRYNPYIERGPWTEGPAILILDIPSLQARVVLHVEYMVVIHPG